MPIVGNQSSGGKKPSAPSIGTVTDGGTGTTVNVPFTPSSYIGKGTIQYSIVSNPGNITTISSSSPVTVSGLTTGTPYTFTVAGITNYGVSSDVSTASNSVTPAVPLSVSGGTLTSDATYYYRRFTSSGTLTVTGGTLNATVLLVAGGGGGGIQWTYSAAHRSGSGGAGGLVYLSSVNLGAGNHFASVGAGGVGAIENGRAPSNGSGSQLGSLTSAVGGGAPGTSSGSFSGSAGGSGGGGGITWSINTGTILGQGAGGGFTSGQGFAGANATNSYQPGGGGGAGGAGSPDQGGPGASYFGATYARGGVINAGGGTANTGNGGGNNSYGASGGSGIIIVRYTRSQVGG